MDPVADTDPIDWDAIVSGHSGKEAQVVKAGEGIETQAKRRPQAAHAEDIRRKAEEKRVEKKGRKVELRQLPAL